MKTSSFLRYAVTALVFSFIAAGSPAQGQSADDYRPEIGQKGKDVIWVPTPQALVDKMLNLAGVTAKDYVIDLGSGDGRTVITAARRGARALGIEYNPDMVALSRRNAEKAGVGDKARFRTGDIFKTDFSDATVLTMFLLPDLNIKLRPKILEMRPGTRVVSNSFTMEEWKPDRSVRVPKEDGCDSYCTAYLWIVPAKVSGVWRIGNGELTLEQEYQTISGALNNGRKTMRVTGGRLRGEEIRFNVGDAVYTGRVLGEKIEGTVRLRGRTEKWTARRIFRS